MENKVKKKDKKEKKKESKKGKNKSIWSQNKINKNEKGGGKEKKNNK